MTDKRERVAKIMSRAGLCSRREAETWIADGRVKLDGIVLTEPGTKVDVMTSAISLDDLPIPMRDRLRLWLYHKPRGLISTNRDPEGRPTIFDDLPPDMPRVISVGRLDMNTEGLVLLTNDGDLARTLEHPSTGWIRRYRVRAFGEVKLHRLKQLSKGVVVRGITYRPIQVEIEHRQGDNTWLNVSCCEGKNLEVKRVLSYCGVKVNRLIRISFGPFHLSNLKKSGVFEVDEQTVLRQLKGLDLQSLKQVFEPERRMN